MDKTIKNVSKPSFAKVSRRKFIKLVATDDIPIRNPAFRAIPGDIEDHKVLYCQTGEGEYLTYDLNSTGYQIKVHEYGEFAPTHVTLFPTDACNLRCIYCYARGGDNPEPAMIPMEAAYAGIDMVAEDALRIGEDAFSVGFHGAGEPTVVWNLYKELIRYAQSKGEETGLQVSCSTCTNGVMPEEHARWVAKNTQTATVSVDGLPHYHDLQRPKPSGKGSFDDVC